MRSRLSTGGTRGLLAACLLSLVAGSIPAFVSATTEGASVSVTYVAGGKPYFVAAVPDNWVLVTGADGSEPLAGMPPMPRIISMYPTDERPFWIGLWRAGRVHTLAQARERFDDLTSFVMEESTVEGFETREINGMQAEITRGHGVKDGRPVQYGVLVFQITPDDLGVGLYLGDPGAWDRYGATIRGIVDSLRPATAGMAQP